MKTIYELQQIANRLRQVMEVNSISPEDTFGLQSDVLEYLADMEQNAEGLGIHKVYASYAAMVADASSPVGSNGKALRFGQLVVICNPSNTIQEENGNIYAWQKGNAGDAAWLLIGNLGSVLGNPQNGYYVCDTAAATAEKEISATSYVLSVGGSMKVKMTNANTADNATLNINSTGVKALYYAGERASSINTWEAGETVEVYYDGTSYYANNVAGGSGSGDGAFDVSAKYPTSGVDGSNTYTLGGALAVLNANLSANKKKGGMSIKFIQSSDNNYVQYTLLADDFSINPLDWQSDSKKINAIENAVSELSNSEHVVDGIATLMGVWETGTINLTSGAFSDNINRARTIRKVKYDKDINIYTEKLFALYIITYTNESDITPASYRIIYPQNNAVIEKDKWYNFVILGYPDDVTGLTIEELKKKVQVFTAIYENKKNVTSLSGHVERLENALSEKSNSEHLVDGVDTILGTFEVGSINPIDGAYTNNMTWIRTIKKVKYDKEVNVHVANGYTLNIIKYANEEDTTPESYSSLYGNNYGTIEKNKWIHLCILQHPSVVDPVDIENYKKKVEVYTLSYYNAQNISKLQEYKDNAHKVEQSKISFQGLTSVTQVRPVYSDKDVIYKDDNISCVSTSAVYNDIFFDLLNPKVGKKVCLSVEPTKEFVGMRIIAYSGETQSSTIIAETGTHQVHNAELMVPFGTKLLRGIIYIADGTAVTPDETYEFRNVKFYYKDESILTKKFVNPRMNLFAKEFIVDNVNLSGTNDGNYALAYQSGAKAFILPLFDYGTWNYSFDDSGTTVTITREVHLKIYNMRKSVWSHRAVLLDKDMNPLGTYTTNKWSWEDNNYAINLKDAGYAAAKYIAIKLFDSSDILNQDASKGYPMSAREKANRMPDWVENVVINIDYDAIIKPNPRTEVQYGFAEGWWDESKKYNNQKFGNVYKDKLYVLSYLKYYKNFNFLMASDSHIPANGASRRNVVDMVDFANDNSWSNMLDCIIHNGDVSLIGGPNPKEKKLNLLEDYFSIVKKSNVDYIQAVGNHDKGQEANALDVALTNTDVCDLFKQYTKHTADTLYQYYDYADKKVRIIKIDAYDYPLEDDGSGNVKYNLATYNGYISQTQFQWIASSLLSTPDGYSVIVTGHLYPLHKLVTQVTELMYALKNKASGTAHIDLSTEILVPPSPTFDVSYDFTGANSINIVGLFCGHDHMDSCVISSGEPDEQGKYTNSIDNSKVAVNTHGITVMGIRCQMMRDITWRTHRDRMPYTDSQNCFNMISVDTKNKKMYVNRYGVEADAISASDVVPILYGREEFNIM